MRALSQTVVIHVLGLLNFVINRFDTRFNLAIARKRGKERERDLTAIYIEIHTYVDIRGKSEKKSTRASNKSGRAPCILSILPFHQRPPPFSQIRPAFVPSSPPRATNYVSFPRAASLCRRRAVFKSPEGELSC